MMKEIAAEPAYLRHQEILIELAARIFTDLEILAQRQGLDDADR
jgi:hypothetical protein